MGNICGDAEASGSRGLKSTGVLPNSVIQPSERVLADAAATRALGVELARLLLPTVGDHQHPGDASAAGSSVAAADPSASVSPPILLLEGDLGAGKTCLVQGLAEGLGIDEPITSPTFALAQHYTGRRGSDSAPSPTGSPAGSPTALVHLDLYRLEQPAAADELFAQEEEEAAALGALLAVEWPSRLSFVPAGAWRVALALAQPDRPEAGRRATIQRL